MRIKSIITLALLNLFLTPICLAKEVNLYDSPNSNNHVIGKINLETGFVPIFSPDKSEWMKVGDPQNGNVGWIKSTDIKDKNTGTAVTFTQKVINNDGKTQERYQVIQYGEPKKMNDPEADKLLKKMQVQQQAIQESLFNLMRDMNTLYQQNMQILYGKDFREIMPTVLVPVPNKTVNTPTTSTKPATTAKPTSNEITR